jgi:hypothetical protein
MRGLCHVRGRLDAREVQPASEWPPYTDSKIGVSISGDRTMPVATATGCAVDPLMTLPETGPIIISVTLKPSAVEHMRLQL